MFFWYPTPNCSCKKTPSFHAQIHLFAWWDDRFSRANLTFFWVVKNPWSGTEEPWDLEELAPQRHVRKPGTKPWWWWGTRRLARIGQVWNLVLLLQKGREVFCFHFVWRLLGVGLHQNLRPTGEVEGSPYPVDHGVIWDFGWLPKVKKEDNGTRMSEASIKRWSLALQWRGQTPRTYGRKSHSIFSVDRLFFSFLEGTIPRLEETWETCQFSWAIAWWINYIIMRIMSSIPFS